MTSRELPQREEPLHDPSCPCHGPTCECLSCSCHLAVEHQARRDQEALNRADMFARMRRIVS